MKKKMISVGIISKKSEDVDSRLIYFKINETTVNIFEAS